MWIRIGISLLILPKNLVKIACCFGFFLAKNRFCLLFVYIVSDCKYCRNFEGTLTL